MGECCIFFAAEPCEDWESTIGTTIPPAMWARWTHTILKQTSGHSFTSELSRLKVFRLALSLITTKFSGFRLSYLFSFPRPQLGSLRSLVFFFTLLLLEACLQAKWNTFVARTHEVRGHIYFVTEVQNQIRNFQYVN